MVVCTPLLQWWAKTTLFVITSAQLAISERWAFGVSVSEQVSIYIFSVNGPMKVFTILDHWYNYEWSIL